MKRILVLCEDQRQETFIRRFLKKSRMEDKCRYCPFPDGKGAGEQHVRESYPRELKLARDKKTFLLVMIDADKKTAEERRRQFAEACKNQDISPEKANDPVAVFIPARNIETWIYFLKTGEKVDESTDYSNLVGKDECKPQAKKLRDICAQQGKQLANAPDSLKAACEEWDACRKAVL